MTISGQFSCPPASSYVAVYGQDLVAAVSEYEPDPRRLVSAAAAAGAPTTPRRYGLDHHQPIIRRSILKRPSPIIRDGDAVSASGPATIIPQM